MPTPFSRDQLSPAMQHRYGLDRRPIGQWAAVALLVGGFAAAMLYVGVGLTRSDVDARVLSWEVVGQDRVNLRLDVRRPAAEPVECVVRAQDSGHADVGYATITIPPGDEHAVVSYSLRTLAPAYVTELLGCSSDGAPTGIDPPQFPAGVVPPTQPY